jgi:hypothetical protein
LYSGEKDVDRLSKDLSMKDLERLVRRFSSLNKKHEVSSSCRVEPYSGSHALPEVSNLPSNCSAIFDCFFIFLLCTHLDLAFALHRAIKFYLLFPLPEGGEVDERAVVTDDSQETSRPESEVAGSQKSAASSEKETESEHSDSGPSISPPLAISPGCKRKRDDVEDSGTSKPSESAAKETSPEEDDAFGPYDDAGAVSS